jgi:hypothetical protein
VELFPSTIEVHKPSIMSTPVAICVIFFLLVLALTVWEYRSKKYFKVVDVSLFLITGFLGLLITWLWGWSLHIYVHNNLHIIWASPLNLFGAVCLMICSKMKWVGYYFAFYALSVILFIMVSFFVVQEFHPASYFIMGAMIVRAGSLFISQRTQLSK